VPLAGQSLAQFLDDVAGATPAPGGGSSTAVACGLGAALVEMAAGIGGADGARVRAVRERALELAEEELSSYAPVLEARRRREPERVGSALLEASRSPLEIAEAAAEVAEIGAEVAAQSNPSVRGDAIAGVLLAEAAACAAAGLVGINLAGHAGGAELLARAGVARDRAALARERTTGG
jgi:formiminotetrahydrofolate cyclodeaminase